VKGQQGGSVLGYWRPVKAAQGQSRHGATGLGAWAEMAMWPATSGRLCPFRVIGKGKRGKSPCEPSPWTGRLERGVARRARQPAPGRPIMRTSAGQHGAAGRREEKGEEERSRVVEMWVPHVREREKKRKGRRLLGCWAAVDLGRLAALGKLGPS
jgi:hypothetical protein